MYQHIITADTYRRYGQRKRSWQLGCALLLAMMAHILLLTELTNPIEKHDAPLPHRVSLLEVELVDSATASEQMEKPVPKKTKEKPSADAEPEKHHVVAKTPAPDHTPVPKWKNVIPLKHKQSKAKKSISRQQPIIHIHKAVPQPSASPASQVVAAATTTTKIQPVAQARPQQINRGQLRQHYLARIMQLIKVHKLYPYSARRRHIEGDVQISFSLDANGQPSHIQINGKHTVLERASRQAIADAQPFPPVPKAIGSSIRIEFTMQYSLLQ
jgi:protein TonB